MAFLENFLIPLIQAIVTLALIILILIGIYFLIIKYFKKPYLAIKFFLKYKILRRAYNHDMVQWSLDMINKDIDIEHLEKEFYLTNMFNLGQFDEGFYVYKKIKKMQGVKGGK